MFYDAEQNKIERIDCLTGERRLLAQDVLPAGSDMLDLNLCFYDEGRLLGSFYPPDQGADYSGRVFLTTGADPAEKTPFGLTHLAMERALPVYPIAKIAGEDSYFVIADETILPREDRREDGTAFPANIPVPVYEKIRRGEFWAGAGVVERTE